ncbi:MAG: DUF3035 domain-containing protein [Alphaproteobacteria bacterium]|nr:DUF3035 domain-containing protein [Alphaproteobacteria bacterium]
MTAPRSLIALGLVLALSACGGVRESLGLGRNPPDEFAVVDRPPLSMPPDYGLRPPEPGAPRPQETHTSQQASDVLFGSHASTAVEASASEKALLEASHVAKADPNIRQVVEREAAQKVSGTRHLVDELLWWKKREKPATTVDAPAEAERIRETKDKGEPINQGATPVIERQKSGWLGL